MGFLFAVPAALGAALIAVGLWMIFPPVALIALGAFCFRVAMVLDETPPTSEEPPL